MKVTLVVPALAIGTALANSAPLPRSFNVVRDAMASLHKRQHDHAHYNVVFPQECVTQCQAMVRVATSVFIPLTSYFSMALS